MSRWSIGACAILALAIAVVLIFDSSGAPRGIEPEAEARPIVRQAFRSGDEAVSVESFQNESREETSPKGKLRIQLVSEQGAPLGGEALSVHSADGRLIWQGLVPGGGEVRFRATGRFSVLVLDCEGFVPKTIRRVEGEDADLGTVYLVPLQSVLELELLGAPEVRRPWLTVAVQATVDGELRQIYSKQWPTSSASITIEVHLPNSSEVRVTIFGDLVPRVGLEDFRTGVRSTHKIQVDLSGVCKFIGVLSGIPAGAVSLREIAIEAIDEDSKALGVHRFVTDERGRFEIMVPLGCSLIFRLIEEEEVIGLTGPLRSKVVDSCGLGEVLLDPEVELVGIEVELAGSILSSFGFGVDRVPPLQYRDSRNPIRLVSRQMLESASTLHFRVDADLYSLPQKELRERGGGLYRVLLDMLAPEQGTVEVSWEAAVGWDLSLALLEPARGGDGWRQLQSIPIGGTDGCVFAQVPGGQYRLEWQWGQVGSMIAVDRFTVERDAVREIVLAPPTAPSILEGVVTNWEQIPNADRPKRILIRGRFADLMGGEFSIRAARPLGRFGSFLMGNGQWLIDSGEIEELEDGRIGVLFPHDSLQVIDLSIQSVFGALVCIEFVSDSRTRRVGELIPQRKRISPGPDGALRFYSLDGSHVGGWVVEFAPDGKYFRGWIAHPSSFRGGIGFSGTWITFDVVGEPSLVDVYYEASVNLNLPAVWQRCLSVPGDVALWVPAQVDRVVFDGDHGVVSIDARNPPSILEYP